jgi:hypothetical protein
LTISRQTDRAVLYRRPIDRAARYRQPTDRAVRYRQRTDRAVLRTEPHRRDRRAVSGRKSATEPVGTDALRVEPIVIEVGLGCDAFVPTVSARFGPIGPS